LFELGANVLGACCYFATTSEKADNENKEEGPDGEKYMIMARVITGEYCEGYEGLRQAPYKPGSGYIHYDSVVDDVRNPTMYGVFDDSSVWPEYVIKYKHIFKPKVTATPSPREPASASTYSRSPAPSRNQSPAPSRSQSPAPSCSQSPAPSRSQSPASSRSQSPAPSSSRSSTPSYSRSSTPSYSRSSTPSPNRSTSSDSWCLVQ